MRGRHAAAFLSTAPAGFRANAAMLHLGVLVACLRAGLAHLRAGLGDVGDELAAASRISPARRQISAQLTSSWMHLASALTSFSRTQAAAQWSVLALSALSAPPAAHEAGAPFSEAIIERLVLHHAHIENEQRMNLSLLRRLKGFAGRRRSGLDAGSSSAGRTAASTSAWRHSFPSAGVPARRAREMRPGSATRPASGWQLRGGVSIPRSAERGAGRTLLLQISNHRDWDALL